MLARILRSNTKIFQATSVRGGGGDWPRPDTPLVVTEPSKRRWSMFENGLWLTDGSQPEFCLSNQEEWFERFTGAGRQAFTAIMGVMAVCCVFTYIGCSLLPRAQMPTNGLGYEELPGYQMTQYMLKEKPVNKECFFDSGIKGNTGAFPTLYEESYMEGSHSKWQYSCMDKKQMILESRDWVAKEKATALANAQKKLEGGHIAHH